MKVMTDEEFEIKFKHCEINPADFDHVAHVRLAWYCINKYGMKKALEIVPKYIKDYVSFLGADDKYHTTLTIAALHTVYHFIGKSTATTFQSFVKENPRLTNNFSQLISHHYSDETFHLPEARLEYFPPDLVPYDNY